MTTSPMSVPLLDLKPQYAALRDEIDAAIRAVCESQYFILGGTVASFEEAFAAYCGSPHAIGCASGSDALLLPLMALGVEPGDEVICPAYTFFATAGSIARLGATPVFADIDPVTYNMDLDHARELASSCKRLRAIMPVHLFGQSMDAEECLSLAASFGVPVIEDAAQAVGSRDGRGRMAGTWGEVGCFSFFPTKNLGAFGDGGAMTTNRDDLAESLKALRVHGMEPKYYHKLLGINSRLDALQAAVLEVKLRHLEGWHAARSANADRYDALFHAAGATTSATPLADGGFPVRTPQRPPAPARHIYNQYVIRVPASLRDDLRAHLSKQGIGTEVYYPVCLHQQECFAYLGGREGQLPHSEAAAGETIALPIYPDLADEQIEHVAKTIIAYVGKDATVRA